MSPQVTPHFLFYLRYDLMDRLFYPAMHLAVRGAYFCGFALLPREAAGLCGVVFLFIIFVQEWRWT